MPAVWYARRSIRKGTWSCWNLLRRISMYGCRWMTLWDRHSAILRIMLFTKFLSGKRESAILPKPFQETGTICMRGQPGRTKFWPIGIWRWTCATSMAILIAILMPMPMWKPGGKRFLRPATPSTASVRTVPTESGPMSRGGLTEEMTRRWR